MCNSISFQSIVNFCCHRILQKNSCSAIIGSGVEENRNSSEPMSACLSAPRGICNGIMNDQPVLFIADSNSSSIRVVTLQDGNVTNLVGGDADPTVGLILKQQEKFPFSFSIK
jgi:hypothetical protein